MAVIVPGKGETRDVAKLLLSVVDDPHVIGTSAEGPDGVTFVVPEDVYDKYLAAVSEQPDEDSADEAVDEKPKRRGRPPGSRNKPKDSEE